MKFTFWCRARHLSWNIPAFLYDSWCHLADDLVTLFNFSLSIRYRKQERMTELGLSHPSGALVPFPDESSDYPRRLRLPPTSSVTAPDRIFLCRKVYDFRQKRILKNPNWRHQKEKPRPSRRFIPCVIYPRSFLYININRYFSLPPRIPNTSFNKFYLCIFFHLLYFCHITLVTIWSSSLFTQNDDKIKTKKNPHFLQCVNGCSLCCYLALKKDYILYTKKKRKQMWLLVIV